MSVVSKTSKAVAAAGGVLSAISLKVAFNEEHGDVESVKIFGFIPLFRRDKNGKARILGIPAKRLSR